MMFSRVEKELPCLVLVVSTWIEDVMAVYSNSILAKNCVLCLAGHLRTKDIYDLRKQRGQPLTRDTLKILAVMGSGLAITHFI